MQFLFSQFDENNFSSQNELPNFHS